MVNGLKGLVNEIVKERMIDRLEYQLYRVFRGVESAVSERLSGSPTGQEDLDWLRGLCSEMLYIHPETPIPTNYPDLLVRFGQLDTADSMTRIQAEREMGMGGSNLINVHGGLTGTGFNNNMLEFVALKRKTIDDDGGVDGGGGGMMEFDGGGGNGVEA
ncbi:hypothetical protein HDU76_006649, partial [Blyttiomyces sp. JEL0837]